MAENDMNLSSPEQLEIIDKLRSLGIPHFVALPQIVAVGDQSRGQSELTTDSTARLGKETEFFSREPWSRLDRSKVGIPALQKRLQQLLVEITRREFPQVKSQIVDQLSKCRGQLEAMGEARDTTSQQRRYLLALSKEFQDITTSALDVYYFRRKELFIDTELRLATVAMKRMEDFSNQVLKFGHMYNFQPKSQEEQLAGKPVSDMEVRNGSQKIYDQIMERFPELERSRIQERSRLQPRNDRPFHIANTLAATITEENIAISFIVGIVFFVHNFITKVLENICADERVRSTLLGLLEDQLLDRYSKAIDHVKFIIEVEGSGTPLTTNHYFNDNLQKFRSSRQEKLLAKHTVMWNNEKVLRLGGIQHTLAMDNAEHTIQDIHDILESYYKVAQKRFVDTVCMQGSDHYLLTGDASPLRVFGTVFVSHLSDSELERIAGENTARKCRRKKLREEIMALEKGRELLKV